MSEHTDAIRRRFSALEWERAELLGFPVPKAGMSAILERNRVSADWLIKGYTRQRSPRRRVPCVLTRGAIRVRTVSMRQAAARLRVGWDAIKLGLRRGTAVNGWRINLAA